MPSAPPPASSSPKASPSTPSASATPRSPASGPSSRPKPGSPSPPPSIKPAVASSRRSGTSAASPTPIFLNGQLPVAPTAIAATGHVSLSAPRRPFVTPRALELHEIPAIIEAFRRGAENAKTAGFDGVEIHGANGYLLDQFLQDGTNHRTDEYGGPIENRARLMLEVADAAISVFGPGRVGMHLAPRGDAHGISDSNPAATFTYLARELGKRKIAFIAAREHLGEGRLGPQLKQAFGGVYIANENFTREAADQVIARGEADAVAFGKLFIANPDLPLRFAENAPLNQPVPASFYAHTAEGYTDYPSLQPAHAAAV